MREKFKINDNFLKDLNNLTWEIAFLAKCFGFTLHDNLAGTITVDAICVREKVMIENNIIYGLISKPKETINTP